MDREELQKRTKEFALRVMRLFDAIPQTPTGRAVANQLVRCGTSVAANYRATRRSRSQKEFIAKIGVVTEEADEAAFWLEMVMDSKLLSPKRVAELHEEAEALTRILASSRRTATRNSSRRSTVKSPSRQSAKSQN